MGTGKGWSQEESLLACRAHQAASEDPRKRSGKKKNLFNAQVIDNYVTLLQTLRAETLNVSFPDRIGQVIAQRFRKARCESIKFEGIIKSTKAKDPTGSPTEEEIERAALAIHNGEATNSQMFAFLLDRAVDAVPALPFLLALKSLRTTHAWDMIDLS